MQSHAQKRPPGSSSVLAWIKDVPSPPRKRNKQHEEEEAEEEEEETAKGTKRPRRRSPLRDIDHNTTPYSIEAVNQGMSGSPSKRGRRSRRGGAPSTPRNEIAQRVEENAVLSHTSYTNEDIDADPTPRRSLLQEQRELSSSSSARSRSPEKMAGLKNIQGGMEYAIIDSNAIVDDASHPLHALVEIIEALDEISQAIAVVPSTMRHLLTDPKHRRDFHEHHIDHSEKREALGRAPDIDKVVELLSRTKECEQAQEMEDGWICDVQWPTARLALELSTYTNKINLKNITRAKIQPATLIPTRASGSKLEAKMVDFAYVLVPSPITTIGYRNLDLDAGAPLESFNQTCLHTIADKPLAVSIEAKSSHVAGDAGLPQLSIWQHAHFAKLRKLTTSARPQTTHVATLPPLPLIITHGPNWRFLAATQDVQGHSTLWQYPKEMTMNTKIGVFQVFRALHLILHWVESRYRPWFELEAVPLTPEQRLRLGLQELST